MATDSFPWVWFITSCVIAVVWYILKDTFPSVKNALPYLNAFMVIGLLLSAVVDFSELWRGITRRFLPAAAAKKPKPAAAATKTAP